MRSTETADLLRLAKSFYRSNLYVTEKQKSVAFFSGATVDTIVPVFELLSWARGLPTKIYKPDYGSYQQEILNPISNLYKSKIDIACFFMTPRDFNLKLPLGTNETQAEEYVARIVQQHIDLAKMIKKQLNVAVTLNTLPHMPLRPHGNFEAYLPGSSSSLINRFNQLLIQKAPKGISIFDLNFESQKYGLNQFWDDRFWFHSKQPIALGILGRVMHSYTAFVAAQFGIAKKVLVLDLDHTLWGGVIGDDGLEGIKLGEGDAEGEAYKEFQQYCLELKNRGVLLAISSKNEENNGLLPFEKHPESILKKNDFVTWRINWSPKGENIKEMANELSLGLEHFVFFDDNPAERENVRQLAPQVTVVEVPTDPTLYRKTLDDGHFFETTSISQEDLERSNMYQQNVARDRLSQSVTNIDDFLKSLEMKAVIQKFEPVSLPRVTQLINKTNQFNLTTKRYTLVETEEIMKNPKAIALSVRLADRFGDNGLISVFIGLMDEMTLNIDTWLMSCRVLKRQMEETLFDFVVNVAKSNNIQKIIGTYIPTEKNGLVKEHYSGLGFKLLKTDGKKQIYEYDIKSHVTKTHHIQIVETLEK
ncbi:MAG: hypothetical protein A4S09_00245 [Proteobacteria bacterium SG_bin7]|nr:MAG: hypothetical protein A4S09_00245 [Proteobacteria bacterium SG_bin7]